MDEPDSLEPRRLRRGLHRAQLLLSKPVRHCDDGVFDEIGGGRGGRGGRISCCYCCCCCFPAALIARARAAAAAAANATLAAAPPRPVRQVRQQRPAHLHGRHCLPARRAPHRRAPVERLDDAVAERRQLRPRQRAVPPAEEPLRGAERVGGVGGGLLLGPVAHEELEGFLWWFFCCVFFCFGRRREEGEKNKER